MEFFAKFIDKELISCLDLVLGGRFHRIGYTEAVELLAKSGEKFEFPVAYGANLQIGTRTLDNRKTFQMSGDGFNYPKEIKPFYMRLNDDGKTVTAMDVWFRASARLSAGASARNVWRLEENMRRHKMDPADSNGTSTSGVTVPFRTQASGSASSAC